MTRLGLSGAAARVVCGLELVVAFALVLAGAGCSASNAPHGGQNNGGAAVGGGATGGTGGGGAGISSAGGTGVAGLGGGGAGSAGTGVPVNPNDKRVDINNCPGMVSPANVTALQAPGLMTVAPMRWLYPYESTVFPRGLTAPLLQWDDVSSTAADAVYVHLHSAIFDYKGCLPPTKAGQLQLPQDIWEQAGAQSKGGVDPLVIELATISGGKASALPARKIQFALAQLKNAIYYNTYGSALANNMMIVGGVVMRITPKKPQPDVFLKADNAAYCIGCHAVSADGSTLVAEEHTAAGLTEGSSYLFDLKAAGAGTFPMPVFSDLKRAGFSGLYPDGSVYLTTGRPQAGPLGGTGNVSGTFGPENTKLYDSKTGMEIANSGAPAYALMPMFSTDGKMVVFNHLSDTGTGGHELAVMDFDRASNQFKNLKSIYTDASQFVGWPSFLPDVASMTQELMVMKGRKIVFAAGGANDYVTQDAPAGITTHASDLFWVDLDTGMKAQLNRACGFEGATNFMPYGDRDAHTNYIPTVSPVAAGGYFWMFFSSRRQYGNELTNANVNANEAKKIWVSAIDLSPTPGADPSHPAFYLSEQEAASGNIRAFAALTPCKVDGDTCETGLDCCSGHCLNGKCGVPMGPHCSEIDEKCTKTSDCCAGKSLQCIGGFCGIVVQ